MQWLIRIVKRVDSTFRQPRRSCERMVWQLAACTKLLGKLARYLSALVTFSRQNMEAESPVEAT